MEDERQLWDRLDGESPRAFYAFTLFRDMGTSRSYNEVGERISKEMQEKRNARGTVREQKPRKRGQTGTITSWAKKHQWRERAAAYDAELERIKLREQVEAIKTMAERHASIAMLFQQKIVQRMQEFDASHLTANQLAIWLDTAAKIERTARGQPTEIVKQEHSGTIGDGSRPDLSRLSVEELRQLEGILSKLDDPEAGGSPEGAS